MPQKYGYLANAEKKMPCLICDEQEPTYSWTDFYGEAYCVKCGTPYQLREPSGAKLGQEYPHCNIKEEFIPLLRQYWQETGRGNGLGSFMSKRDYPDQIENNHAFNEWVKANPQYSPKNTE